MIMSQILYNSSVMILLTNETITGQSRIIAVLKIINPINEKLSLSDHQRPWGAFLLPNSSRENKTENLFC